MDAAIKRGEYGCMDLLKGLEGERARVAAEFRQRGGSWANVNVELLARACTAVEDAMELEHQGVRVHEARMRLRTVRRRLELAAE